MKRTRVSWVVVALLILLGALALPFLMPVKAGDGRNASQVSLSNLKQLATSLAIYASDYDERYPSADVWMSVLIPYTKGQEIFFDPLAAENPGKSLSYVPPSAHILELVAKYPAMQVPGEWGYAFDSRLGGAEAGKIVDPSHRILLFRGTQKAWNANNPFTAYRVISGRCGIAFADGHVKPIDQDLLHPEMEWVR